MRIGFQGKYYLDFTEVSQYNGKEILSKNIWQKGQWVFFWKIYIFKDKIQLHTLLESLVVKL